MIITNQSLQRNNLKRPQEEKIDIQDKTMKEFKAIKNKNILEIIKLIFEINLYSRKRYWLTDIYYCLKN